MVFIVVHKQSGMYLDGQSREGDLALVDCPGQTLMESFVSVNGSWMGKTKVSVSENHMQIHVTSSIDRPLQLIQER